MNTKAIERWIKSQLLELPGLDKFSVRHLQLEGRGRDLALVRIPSGGDADANARTIVDAVASAALEHAEAYDRVERYSLVALSGKGEDLCCRDFCEQGSLRSRYEGASDPPTTAGERNMLMRHLEAKERLCWEIVGKMTDAVVKENTSLRASRDALEEATTRRRIEVEHLVDGRHWRELEARTAEKDDGRKQEAWEKLAEVVRAMGFNLEMPGTKAAAAKPSNGSNGNGAASGSTAKPDESNGAANTNGTSNGATAKDGSRKGDTVDGAAHKVKLADALSKLPASVLDEIGKYLTKQELDDLLP